MSRFFRLSGMPLACLMAIVGCVAAPVTHEEEAHELPRHHPRTFRRAIDAIEERSAAVASGAGTDARRELADIVRWLPMLAADTELGRADWDRVQGISLALASTLDAAGGQPEIVPQCREAVAGLRAIADSLPVELAATEEAR